jgi:hypothetical protein
MATMDREANELVEMFNYLLDQGLTREDAAHAVDRELAARIVERRLERRGIKRLAKPEEVNAAVARL